MTNKKRKGDRRRKNEDKLCIEVSMDKKRERETEKRSPWKRLISEDDRDRYRDRNESVKVCHQ